MTTDTISTEDRIAYECPDWCVRPDHFADVVNEDSPPYHYGPDFGIFDAMAEGRGEREVSISEPISFKGALCAVGLRKVAADALAAAEWLEATR